MATIALALSYAFLANFHTFFDPDLGWHMATARYMLQHHEVPHTDVFSYTSTGEVWRYPPFAGLVFYLVQMIAGYAGLTWFCSLSLVALVACLMRPPSTRGSITAAALAILAIPILARRMSPHPDLFTHLFFAIFLVQIWRFHRGDQTGAVRRWSPGLWLLPIVMLIWVNFHPGFVVGLGEVLAYLVLDGLELLIPSRRAAALQRLHGAWLPLAITPLVALLNPYGYKIFDTSLTLAGLHSSNMATSGVIIGELQPVPLPGPGALFALALDWRDPNSSFWWLVVLAILVVFLALWQRRFGAALLMVGALCAGVQRVRYNGLFAIVVVVVGGAILTEALMRYEKADPMRQRSASLPMSAAVCVLAVFVLTCARSFDLISSRTDILTNANVRFGVGQSSWFPERAADFILHEHLPGNIFESENLGGFAIWRFSPGYGNFVDGRNVSPTVGSEYLDFTLAPPDSPTWEAEIERRHINTIFYSLARYPGTDTQDLSGLCQSRLFRAVYLDDVSIVLVRDTPENHPWLDRLKLDCGKQSFTPPANASRVVLADFYANVGTIELFLGRLTEAQQSLERSAELAPEDPIVHLALAKLYMLQRAPDNAETEFKTAVSLRSNNADARYAFAIFYVLQERFVEARPLALEAAQLDAHPASAYSLLGRIDLGLHEPDRALANFDCAERTATEWRGREDQNAEFYTRIAAGRAAAYAARNDWKAAIQYQQEATYRTPSDPDLWLSLANIYDAAGEPQLAEGARQQARLLPR